MKTFTVTTQMDCKTNRKFQSTMSVISFESLKVAQFFVVAVSLKVIAARFLLFIGMIPCEKTYCSFALCANSSEQLI